MEEESEEEILQPHASWGRFFAEIPYDSSCSKTILWKPSKQIAEASLNQGNPRKLNWRTQDFEKTEERMKKRVSLNFLFILVYKKETKPNV